jgi:hypothetical protein
MKVDWQAAAVVVFIVAALIGWGVSVEVRLAQHAGVEMMSQRIKNIEDLMTPVLVDWKVQQELKKYGMVPMVAPVPPTPVPTPVPPTEHPMIGRELDLPTPVPSSTEKPDHSQIEKDAQKWASDRVQQRSQRD